MKQALKHLKNVLGGKKGDSMRKTMVLMTIFKTTDFARPAELSPNTRHGHHWFGNAESYFLIGDALGEGMKKLLK